MRYRDRVEAGQTLARELADRLGDRTDALVLAVPRGGVPVAAEVASELGADLDVAVARKLGAPGNPEFAVGAVAADGVPVVSRDIVTRYGISDAYLEAESRRQVEEIARRERAYRGERPLPRISGRTVIVVDDGIATGATVDAVLRWVRRQQPGYLVCAVPVASRQGLQRMEETADEVVCPSVPRFFMAVGEWYQDFRQVSDAEVQEILRRARD